MPALPDYGPAIVATTAALHQLLQSPVGAYTVTTRGPRSTRVGVTGASLNLFLYRDALTRYRSGNEPLGAATVIEQRLQYLVTAYPPGADPIGPNPLDPDPDDAEGAAMLAYGAARSIVEDTYVLSVALPSGATMAVRLQADSLSMEHLTSLWIASDAPLRLGFVITASMALPQARPFAGWKVVEDIAHRLEPGGLVTIAGADRAAIVALAATVAEELGRPLERIDLGNEVSRFLDETERNLAAVFERAERSGALLLFEEADALFGRRTEVQDSSDRYAGVDPAAVLDMLRASGGAILSLIEAGPALEDSASSVLRFPPA